MGNYVRVWPFILFIFIFSGSCKNLEAPVFVSVEQVEIIKQSTTEITIAGTGPQGDAPFHDRMIIGPGCGLRIGGSLNGLAGKQYMQITPMESDEAKDAEAELDRYLFRRVRNHGPSRVIYESFTI